MLTPRIKDWKISHDGLIEPYLFMPPTLLEGCFDHQAALMGKRFNSTVID
jgi:hypothetical protein